MKNKLAFAFSAFGWGLAGFGVALEFFPEPYGDGAPAAAWLAAVAAVVIGAAALGTRLWPGWQRKPDAT